MTTADKSKLSRKDFEDMTIHWKYKYETSEKCKLILGGDWLEDAYRYHLESNSDKYAFIEDIEKKLDGLTYISPIAKPEKRYLDLEVFDSIIAKHKKLVYQVQFNGTMIDEFLIDEVVALETDVHMFCKERHQRNLELTDEMRNFKGLKKLWEDVLEELKLKEDAELPESDLPEGAPAIEGDKEDVNTTLYILADDLRAEYDNGDFQWADSLRDVYKWAEHKYTYKGGKSFKWKSLERQYHKAKANSKL